MSLTLGSRSHLEEAELVRYMDRALDREHTRRARGHLAACAECAARLQAARQRSGAVSSFLSTLDGPPASDERRALAMAAVERARFRRRAVQGWGGRALLQAAAAVALLLTLAFGTPPGRAMVGEAVERLAGSAPGSFGRRVLDWLGEAPAAAPVAAAAADGAAGASAGAGEVEAEVARPRETRPAITHAPERPPGVSAPVGFQAQGNYVLLEFSSRQRAGSAAIWIRSGASASGQVTANHRAERLEAMNDGLRVRNQAASRAEYTIVVPARYRFIRVKIGKEPETVIAVSPSRRDWLWTVSLADYQAPAPED